MVARDLGRCLSFTTHWIMGSAVERVGRLLRLRAARFAQEDGLHRQVRSGAGLVTSPRLLRRQQKQLAGGFAGFEVVVGPGGFCERVGVFEAELERAVGDPAENVAGAVF